VPIYSERELRESVGALAGPRASLRNWLGGRRPRGTPPDDVDDADTRMARLGRGPYGGAGRRLVPGALSTAVEDPSGSSPADCLPELNA